MRKKGIKNNTYVNVIAYIDNNRQFWHFASNQNID